MKELCDDNGIELIFTHIVRTKRELLKIFENELDFFPSEKFFIVFSSAMNICEYSVAVLKGQGFQDKLPVRSVAIFLRKNLKAKTFFTALSKTPEDMLSKARHLDKAVPLIS